MKSQYSGKNAMRAKANVLCTTTNICENNLKRNQISCSPTNLVSLWKLLWSNYQGKWKNKFFISTFTPNQLKYSISVCQVIFSS
jgi:hypothetical protein